MVSCQSVSSVLQTLFAIVVLVGICWQLFEQDSSSSSSLSTERTFEADIAFFEPSDDYSLPVASRKLRYSFNDGTGGYKPETKVPYSRSKGSKGKGSKGGKGSMNQKNGGCSIDLSLELGPFTSDPSSLECESAVTSLDLIYTARNCTDGAYGCQSNDDGLSPLVFCTDFVRYLPSDVVIVAYDDDGNIFYSGKAFKGRTITLSNGGAPITVVNVETYIDNRALPAQIFKFRAECDDFRFGCFSGFGNSHVAGWTSESQGAVTCPRGSGSRSLEYTLDFSITDMYQDATPFDIVYAEFATISPEEEVTPVDELAGLEIDPSTAPSRTAGDFELSIGPTTNITTKFTVLGLTIPERELCYVSLPFQVGGPTANDIFDSLCLDG